MPKPFSEKEQKRNLSGQRLADEESFTENDNYDVPGESGEEDRAWLKRADEEDVSGEPLDLGDILEDMTNYSSRSVEERNSEKDPFAGLSDAEKVAKAIELAGRDDSERDVYVRRRDPGKRPGKKQRSGTAPGRTPERKRRAASARKKRIGSGRRRKRETASARKRRSRGDPERRRKVRRNRTIVALVAVIACTAAVLLIFHAVTHHVYHSYSVIRQEKRSDNVSAYEYVDGYILRYSTEGAALLNQDFESIWNESFTMSQPKADICGKQILIYDQRGTSVYLYNTSGRISDFTTSMPILKAVVSNSDSVAMLLQNGNSTEFTYYESDGSVIADGQSNMSGTGYPADLAVSPNGENLVLSYLRVQGGSVSTTLNFYNFGSSGQGKKNNLIGSDRLAGVIVPEVFYLNDRRMAAVREDGFSIYEGTASISEINQVKFSRDIVSSFHDSSHLAFCFDANSENTGYQLQTYSDTGQLISSTDLDESYQKAEVSGNQIVFYGSSGISIRSMNGFLRFSGQIKDGTIGDVLKMGRNRYLIVTDQTMEIVKLR